MSLGAAIYSAYCAGSAPEVSSIIRLALDGMNFTYVSPNYIGATVVYEDDKKFNQIIIKKGELRPVASTVTHYLKDGGATSVGCDVTQSVLPIHDLPDERIKTIIEGDINLGPGAKFDDPIHVTFSYDTNGVFKSVFYYPRNSRTVEFFGEM